MNPKPKKIIFLGLLISFLSIIRFSAHAQDNPGNIPQLSIFFSPTCGRCIEVKNTLIPDIKKEFKDRIAIRYYDISNIHNYKLMLALLTKYNLKFNIRVPLMFLEGRFLNGNDVNKDNLEAFIKESLASPGIKRGKLPLIDLIMHFKGLNLFTVASAGLIDGINPCAFTVIVFFISFLALQGYIRRELIAVCLCFIFAVFITYLLVGFGVFSFLYRLSKFWIIARTINFLIGVFSITLGFFTLHDFFIFKYTGKTEKLTLQLPQAIKNRIHKIIGSHYRINKNPEGASSKRHLTGLMFTALVTGFLVSVLEAVCTGQTYLPTIIFILKTTHLKLSALGYLLVYNLMFIIPLLAVFIFALFGITSEQFSDFLKRHMLAIKLLMAALFFCLGIFVLTFI